MPSITILGVDPGTRAMGIGWIQIDRSHVDQVLARGCCVLNTLPKTDIATRLEAMLTGLEHVFAERRPHVVVIEKVFLGKNVQSAFTLGQARGLVLALAARSGAIVLEEAAKTAKKSVTGNGGAEKTDVRFMLGHLLGMRAELEEWPLDASDALALAYHGWRTYVIESRMSGRTSERNSGNDRST